MKIGILVFLALVLGMIGYAAVDFYNEDVYTGKLIMTDAEYLGFKEALAQELVKVNELESLSSNSPYVEFSVTVPRGYVFEFGEKEPENYLMYALLFITFALGCGVLGGLIKTPKDFLGLD